MNTCFQRDHQECPVSDCSCKCASLDAMTANVVKELIYRHNIATSFSKYDVYLP